MILVRFFVSRASFKVSTMLIAMRFPLFGSSDSAAFSLLSTAALLKR
jgi:hypothetical protein